MPKFCPNCGSQLIAQNMNYCPECGERVIKSDEQSKVKEGKKREWSFALKLIGLLSIIGGFIVILIIYVNPVIEIMGQELTLAQMNSYCENAIINAMSAGSCSRVHDQFYFEWGISVVLMIAGIIELALS